MFSRLLRGSVDVQRRFRPTGRSSRDGERLWCLGDPHARRTTYLGPDPDPAAVPPPAAVLRVASWNVHFGADPAGLAAAIGAEPALAAADVLLIQEVEAYPDEPGCRAARLAAALGMTWAYAPARQEGQLDVVWSENSFGGAECVRRWTEGFNRLYGLQLNARFTPGPAPANMEGISINNSSGAPGCESPPLLYPAAPAR